MDNDDNYRMTLYDWITWTIALVIGVAAAAFLGLWLGAYI
jgi:hypothetical protein